MSGPHQLVKKNNYLKFFYAHVDLYTEGKNGGNRIAIGDQAIKYTYFTLFFVHFVSYIFHDDAAACVNAS